MRLLGALLIAVLHSRRNRRTIPRLEGRRRGSAEDAPELHPHQHLRPARRCHQSRRSPGQCPRARRHPGQTLRVGTGPFDRHGQAERHGPGQAVDAPPSHGCRPGRREPLGARPVRRRDRRRPDLGTRRAGHEGAGRCPALRVHHAEAAEHRARPRHHPDGRARRGGRWRARRDLDARESLPEFEPEYILDEGGFGSRDLFAPGKLVFGISVAEKKILWLKLTAEGVAGHGSQPHDKNPNDRLVRALARLLSEPMPTSPFSVLDTFKSRVGALRRQQVQQRHSALDDLDHDAEVGRRGAAEGERHSVDRRGDARLPRPAWHVEGAVAEGDRPAGSAIRASRWR